MKLYLVRHGQSQNNIEGRHSGWSKCPLTEQGTRDAKKAGKLIKHLSFDKVFVSDLPRAIQTCQNALPGSAFETSELLREISVGDLRDQYTQDCLAKYGEKYTLYKAQVDFRPFGGENKEQVVSRIRKFLETLTMGTYENVAIFGHAMLISLLMQHIFPTENVIFGFPKNGAVSVVEYTDGQWKLLHWNVTQQL